LGPATRPSKRHLMGSRRVFRSSARRPRCWPGPAVAGRPAVSWRVPQGNPDGSPAGSVVGIRNRLSPENPTTSASRFNPSRPGPPHLCATATFRPTSSNHQSGLSPGSGSPRISNGSARTRARPALHRETPEYRPGCSAVHPTAGASAWACPTAEPERARPTVGNRRLARHSGPRGLLRSLPVGPRPT